MLVSVCLCVWSKLKIFYFQYQIILSPKVKEQKKNVFLAKSTLPMYATFPTTQKIKTWEEFTTPQLVVIVLLDDKSRQLSKQQ